MSEVVIRADRLSKRFSRVPGNRMGLKERLLRRREPNHEGEIWALRDASFEVRRGETLGILGHNGAGKSTALKVVTGIYRPTSGSCTVTGRVAALLELGSGFHPELTGRDNIRLNAAILGFSRRQTDAMMAEIIEFSGVESYIDMPVKLYSSGMYARLGFAVAVQVDPEILILDEVFAVGDESFRRRGADRLHHLRKLGTTIVIVSHQLALLERMCDTAVWLDHGHVAMYDAAPSVIRAYREAVNGTEAARKSDSSDEPGSPSGGVVTAMDLAFWDRFDRPVHRLVAGEPATIVVEYEAAAPITDAQLTLDVYSETGVLVATTSTLRDLNRIQLPAGSGRIRFRLPELTLGAGTYDLSTTLESDGSVVDSRNRAFTLGVVSRDGDDTGLTRLPGAWSLASDVVVDA